MRATMLGQCNTGGSDVVLNLVTGVMQAERQR